MLGKRTAALVLVVALAVLAGSVAWAFGQGGDRGWSMSRIGPGMMGYAASGSGAPVDDLIGAKRQAQRFADRLDLRVGEVMRFESNYYAELVQRNGARATEVLVNPATGAVFLEYGPAMMWNTRYGMMSRNAGAGGMMMGGDSESGGMMEREYRGDPTWAPSPETTRPSISAQEAEAVAARWLAREGSKLGADTADAFPGYYTLHVLEGERVAGMLSVNAYTGAVWSHWWHGRFLSMSE
ncbi:hypothetical protein [Gaiella sp.]|uniref:hypothetical protein n=1 Tax=Gaiella sp. TaxID=2663207 RepID=UPI003263E477